MKSLDLTFTEAAENLACDEALIDGCEASTADGLLRIWEPQNYFVVVGYSNKVTTEVDMAVCERLGIPVLRRFSGGGTVLQGPGCLNYSLVASNEQVGNISAAYAFVLQRHRRCVAALSGMEVELSGGSDLTISGRKISGNAQHRKRRFTLVHGTFLLQLDLALMAQVLPLPSKEPAYRERRSHANFLMNLPVTAEALKHGLREAWHANEEFDDIPHERIARLLEERYSRPEWNMKF
jgi:lipoate-protein ligase A